MYNKILFGLVAVVLLTGIARMFITSEPNQVKVGCIDDVGMCSDGTTVGRVAPSCSFQTCPTGATLVNELPTKAEPVACTMDAMQCADGSYVGRTGPQCEFVCPTVGALDPAIAASITAKANLITITSPQPNEVIASGVTVTGEARGGWFFEAGFPVTLTNWDGLIIAKGLATAQGDWMTTDFVPYTATLTFTSPLEAGAEHTKRGTLILQKDNPSGLPENDDALEIPIRFAP
jgi:Immunoglobulin-like domain of bacterial spore germination